MFCITIKNLYNAVLSKDNFPKVEVESLFIKVNAKVDPSLTVSIKDLFKVDKKSDSSSCPKHPDHTLCRFQEDYGSQPSLLRLVEALKKTFGWRRDCRGCSGSLFADLLLSKPQIINWKIK